MQETQKREDANQNITKTFCTFCKATVRIPTFGMVTFGMVTTWLQDPSKRGITFVACCDDHILFPQIVHCVQCSALIVEEDGEYKHNYIYRSTDGMTFYQLCCSETCEVTFRGRFKEAGNIQHIQEVSFLLCKVFCKLCKLCSCSSEYLQSSQFDSS
jgi:hypothetical protein